MMGTEETYTGWTNVGIFLYNLWYGLGMTMQTPPIPNDRDRFKQISKAEYDALDNSTKEQLVKTRHTAILSSSEPFIYKQLMTALTQPTPNPDGSMGPPIKLNDLVILLINRDEPFLEDTLPQLAEICFQQGVFVAVVPAARKRLAEELGSWKRKGDKHAPYFEASKALSKDPGPGMVYFVVMDTWMCQVIPIGFDPNAKPETPASPEPPRAA